MELAVLFIFFFSSRRRHTRCGRDWSSDCALPIFLSLDEELHVHREAHLKQTGSLPVNVKFLIEGEEEVGSENLDRFVAANKDLLKSDVVLISDTPMFERGVPSICYGLRGLCYYQIDLRGTKSDLHSGSFGGAVSKPNYALGQILASMKDKNGKVT